MLPDLVFNAERHEYVFRGVHIPGVTQVLSSVGFYDYDFVNPQVMEFTRQLGKEGHSACELLDRGTLDMRTVDPVLEPYIDAWQLFKDASGLELICCEVPFVSAKYRYAGMPDRIGTAFGTLSVIDIKLTGTVSPAVAIQTAGYALLYKEDQGETIRQRLAVQLLPTGKFKLHEFKNRTDEAVFLSALSVYNFKKKNNMK